MSTETSDRKSLTSKWSGQMWGTHHALSSLTLQTPCSSVFDGNIDTPYFYRDFHSDGTVPISFSPLMELLLETVAYISVSGIPVLMFHEVRPSEQNGVCACWILQTINATLSTKCQKCCRLGSIDVGFPVFLIIYLFVFTVGNKVLLIYSIDQSMKIKICFRRLHKGA